MRNQWSLGLVILAVLALIAATAGCGSGAAQASVAQSTAPRVASPSAPPADIAEFVAGNSQFAFDLYRELRDPESNTFYSPFSISEALAMAYAGARGNTEAQMAETLHYTLPQSRLHPAANALDLELAQRGAGAKEPAPSTSSGQALSPPKGQDDQPFRLKIANSVWGQTGYQFVPDYLDTLAKNYDAGLRLTDFQKAPEPAREVINGWVKEQTEGKVVDLLPKGSITDLTRLVLANAVYFNAAWKNPFDGASTQLGQFTLLDGSQVSVSMMRKLLALPHAQGQGYQAVEIPYDGDEVSMLIILPEAGSFEQFEEALTADQASRIVRELRPKQVQLSLPKFTFESTFSLAEVLAAMGMPDAMDPDRADFSGISGQRDLYISDVVHKAIVAVNEKGTEAAAATGVVVGTVSMPVVDVTLTIEHPFVFFIRDVKTDTILFVGRVLNPSIGSAQAPASK